MTDIDDIEYLYYLAGCAWREFIAAAVANNDAYTDAADADDAFPADDNDAYDAAYDFGRYGE